MTTANLSKGPEDSAPSIVRVNRFGGNRDESKEITIVPGRTAQQYLSEAEITFDPKDQAISLNGQPATLDTVVEAEECHDAVRHRAHGVGRSDEREKYISLSAISLNHQNPHYHVQHFHEW